MFEGMGDPMVEGESTRILCSYSRWQLLN